MKRLHQILLIFVALFGFALAGHATVIVDNTWADGIRTNWNLPAEAPWYTWTTGTPAQGFMGVETNALYCTNAAGVTRYFWTYFTSNAPALTIPYMPPGSLPGSSNYNSISANSNCFFGYPVDLSVGQMIKVTTTFLLNEVLPYENNQKAVRFGLLNYDTNDVAGAWQGRVIRDTSQITKSGTNVTGYRLNLPMFGSFPGNNLFGFMYRYNIATDANGKSAQPLDSDNVWTTLGSGSGLTNYSGFQPNMPYTLVWTVARYAASNVLSAALSGGAFTNLGTSEVFTNFTHTRVDTSGTNYHRFDSFMIRFDTQGIPATLFAFKEFKVEVLPAPLEIILVDKINSDSLRLRWTSVDGFSYQVRSLGDLNFSSWVTQATVTATGTTTTWTNTGLTGVGQRFYRVVNTP